MTEPVSIARLKGGAIAEHIDEALRKCYRNILDINTEATARREVTVKIALLPDKQREMVDVQVQATAKLAPDTASGARVVLAGTEEDAEAFEYVPPQMDLQDYIEGKTAEPEKIQRIGGEKKGGTS